jgi:hypothetical protein
MSYTFIFDTARNSIPEELLQLHSREKTIKKCNNTMPQPALRLVYRRINCNAPQYLPPAARWHQPLAFLGRRLLLQIDPTWWILQVVDDNNNSNNNNHYHKQWRDLFVVVIVVLLRAARQRAAAHVQCDDEASKAKERVCDASEMTLYQYFCFDRSIDDDDG